MTLRIQKTTGATLRLNRGSGMTWKITPRWSPTDSDAAAYIAAVEQADGQALEDGVKVAIDNFVRGCKADGIWNAIKSSCIFTGARTLNGALTSLAGVSVTNVNFVQADYNRKTGLLGNGATVNAKYVNTNRLSTLESTSDFHLCVYASTRDSIANSTGRYLAASQNMSILGQTSGFRTRATNGTLNTHGTTNTSPVFIGVSRASSASYSWVYGSEAGISATAVNATVSGNYFVFAQNDTFSQTVTNARIGFYSVGSSIDLIKLRDRVSELISVISAAIP